MKGKVRIRRNILWKKNPNCYWCGRLTIKPEDIKGGGRYPQDNMATLDHLHSKLNPLRGSLMHSNIPTTVLSCWKCNHERGKLENASLPKEELWKRSGSYPLNHPLSTTTDKID